MVGGNAFRAVSLESKASRYLKSTCVITVDDVLSLAFFFLESAQHFRSDEAIYGRHLCLYGELGVGYGSGLHGNHAVNKLTSE